MNKTYRSIWNASLGCYVAAPECASSQRAGTASTRSVRCREPMRSGTPMVLESRVLFDGAMVATVIEQDSVGDAPVIDIEGDAAAVQTTEAAETAEPVETPAAEDASPAPIVAAEVAEEEVAAVPQDTTDAADAPLATPEPVAAPSVEVVFVDGRVPDVASFEAPGREVIVLSLDQDGIAQIASALDGRTDIDAIHIVSHGGDGHLSLGSGQVTTDTIQTVHLQSLQAIAQSLTADGDILIYACDYASGDSGLEAMNLLADITGADVAASVDTTGHESFGGDWALEQSVGAIDAQALDLPSWEGELATYSGNTLVPQLVLSGNATLLTSDTIRLTPNEGGQSGAVQSSFEISLATDFNLSFNVYLGTSDAGADGVTFIMHNDPAGALALGASGGGLGASGIANGVVIEFDTYDNGAPDLFNDHTSVWDSDSNETLIAAQDLGNIETGSWYTVEVSWTASSETLSYTFDGAPMGSASGLVSDGRFGSEGTVHFGWTAATGGAMNDQQVQINSFTGDLNFAPVATDDAYVVSEATATALGSPLANDYDEEGGILSATLDGVEGSAGGVLGFDDSGNLTFNPLDDFDTLADGETAVTTFSYTVSDPLGARDTGSIAITVTGVNDAPVALNDSYAGDEDHAIFLGSPVSNDLDPEGDGKYLSMNTTVGSAGGLFSTDDSGNVFFSPNGDFNQLAVGESLTTSANYLVYDDGGASSSATMTVTVHGLNDNPTAVNDHHHAGEDEFLSLGSLLANDSDPEGDSFALSMNTTRGTNGGMFSTDDSGSVYFHGNGEFDDLVSGQSRDTTFVYSVIDEHGGLSSATATVTVYGANDKPVVSNDAYQAYEDNAVALGSPLVNDSDADGDQLFIELNGAASGGGVFSLSGDDVLTFNPNGEFDDLSVGESRISSIIYSAFDVHGGATLAMATVTVQGLNDNPTALDDTYTAVADTATTLGNALNNDSDVDGDAIQVEAMLERVGSAGGLFSMGASGDLSFNPNGEFDDLTQGQTRVTTVEYTVRDGLGGASTATATVTVSGVGTGASVDPVAPAQSANGDEGLPLGDGSEPPLYPNEVVFVDARVSDPDAFAADGREVIILNLDNDGLAQMAAALNGRTGIEALHIISHGADGYFTLGSGEVNAETMQTTQRAWLESIGQSLTLNGDILVYACDFASTSVGLEAMNVLAQLTVADVAASLYTTGHETLGADWSLEARVGTVEADEVRPHNWVYGLSQASLPQGPAATSEAVVAEDVASVTPSVDTPAAVEPAPVDAESAQDNPVPAPAEGIAEAPAAAPDAVVTVAVESAAPVINAIRLPDLEAAVWQALETATPAVEPVALEALVVAGVETTPEWTQSRVGGGDGAPADHALETPAVVELEPLPLAEAAAADGDASVSQPALRPYAAPGFRAQLSRWAQWPAQRPLTRAVARG